MQHFATEGGLAHLTYTNVPEFDLWRVFWFMSNPTVLKYDFWYDHWYQISVDLGSPSVLLILFLVSRPGTVGNLLLATVSQV